MSVNGPTTNEASIASIPSGPIVRSGRIAPALSIITSRRDSVARTCAVAARIDASEPMSATDDRKAVLAVALDERVANPCQAFLAAAHQDDPGPERGDLLGRLTTEPRRRTGDHHGLAVQRPRYRWRPVEQRGSRHVPDARETAHDRHFEQVVDDGAWIHATSLAGRRAAPPVHRAAGRAPMMDHTPWRHR